MSSYIHLLEVVTALLCLVLASRVHRCYREFYSVAEPLGASQEQDLLASSAYVEVDAAITVEVKSRKAETSSSAPSASDAILSDYIGEFFMDGGQSTNIDEFRAPAAESAVAEQSAAIKPDFDDNIPILEHELDDDSIITVMADKANQEKNHSVMSEKVVHAMLDEAKLVCAS